MKKEIVGLIPVKGNSERIKQKNLRRFGDTTLFELKLRQLQNSKGFTDIIVSSENQEVLDTAKQYGFRKGIQNTQQVTSL